MDSMNDCYNRCHNSFDCLVAALKSPLRDYGEQMPIKGVVNEYARFNVWSGSIGVKHSPHKRISLDYRLRDSQFYKIRVMDILLRLERTICKATQLLHNKRQPFEEVAYHVEQFSDPGSDDTSATRSTDSSIPDELQQTPPESRREMPELYESIQNSIKHLYSMSMVIRRPIPTDRLSRASKIPVQHFQSFDQRHVEECFPQATQVLKKRLANAITLRRQLIEYNEQHHQKSSEIPNPEPAVSQSQTPQPEGQTKDTNTQPPAERVVNPAPSVFERSTRASTEATKFTPPEDLKMVDVQSESGTVSSFGFSEGGGERIRIPPRPQDNDGNPLDQFLCPFCYHLVEIGTTKAWIKHIFRDLQAYICTFDDCKDPNRLFETRNDWIRHEFQHHRREWHCNTLDHPACCSQREFIDHMRRSHSLQVSEDQLQSLSKLCERPAASGVVVCPLCTENQHDIQNGFVQFRSSSTVRKDDEIAIHENTYDEMAGNLRLPDGRFDESLQSEDFARVTGWAMSLPEEYEQLNCSGMGEDKTPSSPQPVTRQVSRYILESTKLKRHLAQHLERLALFSIHTSKMMPDDQASISTGNAIPGSESSLSLSTSLDSRITVDAPKDQETSEFDSLDSDNHLASSLKKKIWGKMEQKDDSLQRFFPESCWDGLWHVNEVEATLRKCTTDPTPDLVHFILQRAYKIFAILVAMRQPELIIRFQHKDFGQEKLPVEEGFVQDMFEDEDDSSDFYDRQWCFLSPIFSKDRFRYKFSKFHRLPYTTTGKKANPGASHYCKVMERSIHVDHVDLSPNQILAKDEQGNPRVAVKELLSSDPAFAEQEASVLEMVRGLQSDHMIKAIAYYQHGEKHYFMFPWAEHGNLWEFWTSGSRARLDKPYIIWVFRQLTGLAAAIEKLHNLSQSRSCRHGDLKPENILCFRDGDDEHDTQTPAVRMVITDVGLARDHIERTQFRESRNTVVGTKRYAGPEMDVNPGGPLSRRFDIWSMGCIFLEFVLWILYGEKELVECTKALGSTFYQIIRDSSGRGTAEVQPAVQNWVSYIRKDWRCPKGTALEKLVHLITGKLLVVNVGDFSPSNNRPKARTYAPGMREDLEDILKGLETNRIKPVGDRPPNDPLAPLGPSHSILTTKDGRLAPMATSTRNVRVAQQYIS